MPEVRAHHPIGRQQQLPRSDAVDGHVEQLPGPHDGEESVDVLEDSHHHLVLVLGRGLILGVGARVDNT